MSITNDCLVHHSSQHIQVRKDFFDLCAYDKSQYNNKTNASGNIIRDEPNQECMAKILRIIETLTNTARTNWYLHAVNARKEGLPVPTEPPEYLIPLAYSALCSLLYNTYGESTLRNSLAALLQMRYIRRYQQSTGSIPCYALDVKVVQEALDKQALEASQNTLLNSTPFFRKPGRPKKGVENKGDAVENNTVGVLNSTAGGVENNTNNISNKKEDNTKKERETPTPTQSPKPSSLSLSPSKSSQEESSLLDQLTDQEADFWTRWGAISQSSKPLDKDALECVRDLAGKVLSTEELQSLYDYSFEKLQEFATSQGRTATPPNLRNLVKRSAEWRAAYNLQKKGASQEQASHEHIPGTGRLTNWTEARKRGEAPPIVYEQVAPRTPKSGLSSAGAISASFEKIRAAREKRGGQP